MNRATIACLIVWFFAGAKAAEAGEHQVELELDPIAYALKGYSVHLGYAFASWKIDLGLAAESFDAEQTDSLLQNQDFQAKFRSYGVKLDFIGSTQSGYHVGLQWDKADWTYESSLSSATAEHSVELAGPRIGYRWVIGRIYLNPWVGFIKNLSDKTEVQVGDQTFKEKGFQIFPTVHLGLRI